jgi:DNA-binding transcriptional LysR family regulator
MLNLERLRVLHALATYGSVRAAAAALHVTTSAVSQQLARLDREAGTQLTERHGRGLRLTDAGTLLAGHAADLLRQVERVEAELAEQRGAVAGTLAVAAFATAARGLLPPVLRRLRAEHPGLTVSLSEQEPTDALAALARGDLDIAVVQDWPDDPLPLPAGVSGEVLCDDALDLAVPVDHPLAGRYRVRLADLSDVDWVSWSDGQVCNAWLTGLLRGNGIEPRIRHTASEHGTQLALVAAGLGVALIPRLGRDPTPPGIRFVPLDPAPVRRVHLAWRASTGRRPTVGAALAALRAGT